MIDERPLSADDPRLDPIRGLRHRRSALLVVEGEIAVRRALAAGAVEQVAGTHAVLGRLEPGPATVHPVEAATLSTVLGFDFHRGVVGWGPARAPAPMPRLGSGPGTFVVVAEGLADPSNLGALVRNARAFRASAVVVDPRGASPHDRRAIRASMGHVFTMPVVTLEPVRAVEHLRDICDAEVMAATIGPHAVSVERVPDPTRARVLLVGNEGQGLSRAARELADLEVTVPVDPQADSINVAAATAVLLHRLRVFSPRS